MTTQFEGEEYRGYNDGRAGRLFDPSYKGGKAEYHKGYTRGHDEKVAAGNKPKRKFL